MMFQSSLPLALNFSSSFFDFNFPSLCLSRSVFANKPHAFEDEADAEAQIALN
jgi:hypothetical protein